MLKKIELSYEFEDTAPGRNYLIILDKNKKEKILTLSIGFGGLVHKGYLTYKNAENAFLNLYGFYPEELNENIGIAIDDEYIYIQFIKSVGPSYGKGAVWVMRKYRYI